MVAASSICFRKFHSCTFGIRSPASGGMVSIALLAVLGGCATIEDLPPAPVPVTPTAHVVRKSATVGVYYGPGFRDSVVKDDTARLAKFTHHPGSANVALFDKLLSAVFSRVVELDRMPSSPEEVPAGVDAMVEPALRSLYTLHASQMAVSLGMYAPDVERGMQWRVRVLDRDLSEIDEWESTARARKPDGPGWQHDAFYQALYRQIEARLIVDFTMREKMVARFPDTGSPDAVADIAPSTTPTYTVFHRGAKSPGGDASEEDYASCVASGLAAKLGQGQSRTPLALRNALYPWLEPTIMNEAESHERILRRPEIRQLAAAHSRYLVVVAGSGAPCSRNRKAPDSARPRDAWVTCRECGRPASPRMSGTSRRRRNSARWRPGNPVR